MTFYFPRNDQSVFVFLGAFHGRRMQENKENKDNLSVVFVIGGVENVESQKTFVMQGKFFLSTSYFRCKTRGKPAHNSRSFPQTAEKFDVCCQNTATFVSLWIKIWKIYVEKLENFSTARRVKSCGKPLASFLSAISVFC